VEIRAAKEEDYGAFFWLMREVGNYLDLDPNPAIWDHANYRRIDSIVESGYQRFLHPPSVSDSAASEEEGEDQEAKAEQFIAPYVWSFVAKTGEIAATTGEAIYDLPAEFSGGSGDLVIDGGRIPLVSEDQSRNLLVQNTETGTPRYAAIRPKNHDGSGPQTWELMIYPRPDAGVTMSYRYTVSPQKLSKDRPWPLGGTQHAETLLQSCLAVAESRERREENQQRQLFAQRLRASIELDKKSKGTGTTWKQPESNLERLRSQVGLYAGFTQNPDAWDSTQREMVDEIVRQGVDRVQKPDPLPGRTDVHKWSFLSPLATLSLVVDKSEYDLPDDFGGFAEERMWFEPQDNVIWPDIQIKGEYEIRRLLQQYTSGSGYPRLAGYGQKAESEAGYQLVLWPLPSMTYTLNYRYNVKASDTVTFLHGGDIHFDVYLEACRAEADVLMKKKQRRHEDRFLMKLHNAIRYDQQLINPGNLGYNRDSSSRQSEGNSRELGWVQNAVNYEGYTNFE